MSLKNFAVYTRLRCTLTQPTTNSYEFIFYIIAKWYRLNTKAYTYLLVKQQTATAVSLNTLNRHLLRCINNTSNNALFKLAIFVVMFSFHATTRPRSKCRSTANYKLQQTSTVTLVLCFFLLLIFSSCFCLAKYAR